jgi:molecular chaperone GrpE (heat shock protein)
MQDITSTRIRIEILATIDELNQYLNQSRPNQKPSNVTKTSLKITLDELINKL